MDGKLCWGGVYVRGYVLGSNTEPETLGDCTPSPRIFGGLVFWRTLIQDGSDDEERFGRPLF